MLGFLRNAFGRKPQTQPLGPSTRTHWQVTEPTRIVHFENKDWAQLWCTQHNVHPARLEEVKKVNDHVQNETERLLVQEMISCIKHGIRMGLSRPLDNPLPSKHLQELYTAFREHCSIDAMPTLMVSAFSINRIDIAQDIGKLLSNWFDMWANPIDPHQHLDPDAAVERNTAFIHAFRELMPHPVELQWLLKNNPQLHARLGEPIHLNRLEHHILELSLFEHKRYLWPAVAHRVFQRQVEPSHKQWELNGVPALKQLLVAFSDNPAAQCSLIEQARFRNWFNQLEPETFYPSNIRGTCRFVLLPDNTQFIAPEAIALMRQFQGRPWTCEEQTQTRLQLLNLGMSDTTAKSHQVHHQILSASRDFYLHANAVFNPSVEHMALPDMPDLEATLQ